MARVLAVLLVGLVAQASSALAQSEATDQRVRCRDLAAQKAAAAFWPRPEIDEASRRVAAGEHHRWRYDEASGRCLVEIEQRYSGSAEVQRRRLFDAAADALLATADVVSGRKSGMVFDARHRARPDSNLGWDDATAYIDRLIAEPIRAAESAPP